MKYKNKKQKINIILKHMMDRIMKKEIQKIKQTQGGQGRESMTPIVGKKKLNKKLKKVK